MLYKNQFVDPLLLHKSKYCTIVDIIIWGPFYSARAGALVIFENGVYETTI